MRIQPTGAVSGMGYSYRTVGQSRRFQTGPIPSTGNSDTGNPGGGVSLSAGRDDHDEGNKSIQQKYQQQFVPVVPSSDNNRNGFGQIPGPQIQQNNRNDYQNGQYYQKQQQKDVNARARTPSQLKGDAKPFVPMAFSLVERSVTPAKTSSAEISPTSVASTEKKPSETQHSLTLVDSDEEEKLVKPVGPSDVITPQKLMSMYFDSQHRQRAVTVTEEQPANVEGKKGGKSGHGRSATIGTSACDFQMDGSRPPLPFDNAKIAGKPVGAANYQRHHHSRSVQKNGSPAVGKRFNPSTAYAMNEAQITPTRGVVKLYQQANQSDGSSNDDIAETPSSQRSGASHVPHPYFQYQSPNTHAMLARNGGAINPRVAMNMNGQKANGMVVLPGQQRPGPQQETQKQVAPMDTDRVPEAYDVRGFKFHSNNRLQPPAELLESSDQTALAPNMEQRVYEHAGPVIVREQRDQQYWDAQDSYRRQQEVELYDIERRLTDKESGVILRPLKFGVPPEHLMANRSEKLQALAANGHPSLEDVLDYDFLPFTACYNQSFATEQNGVVVLKNIPYETTRGECIALLGKNSRILGDANEPVHIIMDRITSKTQDAYCEVSDLNAAIELVEKFKKGNDTGRVARLGSRLVEVELGSQAALMQALFPSAVRGVEWVGATPHPIEDAEYEWENFKGFVTEEEMALLTKHVEYPQRSSFARNCPERPYECMISTLRKVPWYMAGYITIKQRHCIYDCAMRMIKVLATKLDATELPGTEADRLTPQLFNRLVASAMLCPGFSVAQKHNIAEFAGLSEEKSRGFNQPCFPYSWRHQWTLVPKPGVPIDVLEWYIAVIRDETNRVVQNLNISQRMPLQKLHKSTDPYWGYFWAEVNFPVGPEFDNMTLEECNKREWEAIEKILTRAIRGGAVPFSYTTGSNSLPQTGNKRGQRRAIMAKP